MQHQGERLALGQECISRVKQPLFKPLSRLVYVAEGRLSRPTFDPPSAMPTPSITLR